MSLEKVRGVDSAAPTVLGAGYPASGPPGVPAAAPTVLGAGYPASGPPGFPAAAPTVLGAGYPASGPPGSPAAAPTGAHSALPPTGEYPLPPPTTPQPLPARRGRGAAALVFLAVAVLLLAGVGLWFTLRPVAGEAATTPTVPAPTVAAGSANPATDPSARPAPLGPGAGKGAPGDPSPAPATTVTTVATTTIAPDPMGGPRSDIACSSGFIVQIASELDEPTFRNRVATLRSTGMFPNDARWTQTAAGCSLFTSQTNVFVSYAGPFATWADGCPARLSSPPDAFIKSTDPGSVDTFLTCLCPAGVGDLPAITTVGQRGVWVGELQRVLGAGLDYQVGSINADAAAGNPGHWGEYTTETAAAVGRFQADHGLPRTEQVDRDTWAGLQAARC
ncbi:peptidoglycan-binding protein [Nakamurella sp.]|uniref:peptidoglycan-binding protein n=1 Tax=Nakamurella sp. TaxID=1869182 RepID=UPI003783A642